MLQLADPRRLSGRHPRGDALVGLGRFAEAEKDLLEARQVLAQVLGADSASLTRVTESLVKLYERTSDEVKAAEWRQTLPAGN